MKTWIQNIELETWQGYNTALLIFSHLNDAVGSKAWLFTCRDLCSSISRIISVLRPIAAWIISLWDAGLLCHNAF